MKRIEDMTKEELQEYIEQAVNEYFRNVIYFNMKPFYNVSTDIINQLTNYSRN